MDTKTQIKTNNSEIKKDKMDTFHEDLEKVVPIRIILEQASFEALLEKIEQDVEPPEALVDLFRNY